MTGFPHLDVLKRKSMAFLDDDDPVSDPLPQKALKSSCHGCGCLASTYDQNAVMVSEHQFSLTNPQCVVPDPDVPKDRFLWIDRTEGCLKYIVSVPTHFVQG
jgi:hypothetical protein